MVNFEELCFEIENIFIEIEDLHYNSKLEFIILLEGKLAELKLGCNVPLNIPIKDFLDDISDDIIDDNKSNEIEEAEEDAQQEESILRKKVTEAKVFWCEVCHNNFATKETLRKHSINKHSNVRLYKCDKCDKTFKDVTSCKRHAENENLHKNDYKNRNHCTICGKIFVSHFSKQRHIKSIHAVFQ